MRDPFPFPDRDNEDRDVLIKRLRKANRRLAAELTQAERERDAALSRARRAEGAC